MRIIPKNTKVKLQFYKGIGIYDVILEIVALAFIALIVTSNLPSKYIIAMIVLIVVAPMYISIGDIKPYQALGYVIKFGVAKKSFYKNKNGNAHISTIIPYASINDNCITQKDGTFTGVIEIKPIEFNMLSENKQNFLIDGIISNTLKNVGIFQEYDLIKLEKPIILDNYLKNELKRIREILAEKQMSQYRLEMNSGLSKGTLTSLMYARYKGVNLTTLIIVIRTLGISIDEFFNSPLFSEENLDVE